ncbi:hypothetical protein DH26_gp097 [Chloriridovirus anopheles1]|uniref:Uncharacterized protein n=1 Tax=Chloriridovirus anopheles1 TaxID=1465751 RepID=W8QE64_9VIRU|nr:hypothetical protein DH26_gp097 [Anopheles minimus iridovirus]AHL67590.1 hypothetical protein AMIV_097 [Anopheles minimus iridovirus]
MIASDQKNGQINYKTMAFVNDFMRSLALPIGELAKWLEEEHNVPSNSTIEMWNKISGMNVQLTETGPITEEVKNQTINISTTNKKCGGTNPNENMCQHIFLVGKRKGQQCNIKPKYGADKCSAHKPKPKPKPKVKKDTKESGSEGSESAPSKKVSSAPSKKVSSTTRKVSNKPKTPEILESDSKDEQPKPKTPEIPESDSEDEQPKSKPKPTPVKALKVPESDSEESEPEKTDSDSEDEQPKSKPKSTPSDSEESETDSDSEDEQPKSKPKPTSVKALKVPESDSEESEPEKTDSEEEEVDLDSSEEDDPKKKPKK